MANTEPVPAKVRLQQAFDLFDAGVSMKRAAIRRDHPHADETEVQRRLRAWLETRPGARYGDTVGHVRSSETRG